MARCGCAGSQCSCVITAGSGLTRTGSGTEASPYVFSTGADISSMQPITNLPLAGTPGGVPNSHSTLAITASSTRYTPFEVDDSILVTSAAVEVTTAVASAKYKVAIYAATDQWKPAALVANFTEMDCATTGSKVSTLGTPVTLPRGRYLRMEKGALAPTLRYYTYSVPSIPGMYRALGVSPFVSALALTETYANTAPDPGSQPTTSLAGGAVGWVTWTVFEWT